MSDLISREEAQKALYGCVMPNKHAEDILAEVPSADIMECARAIKEYCEKHECERCDFAEHRVLGNTDNYICRVHYACPCGWDLPEGEKKSCITCKNNDDEFSGECYECVKNIQNHYEPEGEKE